MSRLNINKARNYIRFNFAKVFRKKKNCWQFFSSLLAWRYFHLKCNFDISCPNFFKKLEITSKETKQKVTFGICQAISPFPFYENEEYKRFWLTDATIFGRNLTWRLWSTKIWIKLICLNWRTKEKSGFEKDEFFALKCFWYFSIYWFYVQQIFLLV